MRLHHTFSDCACVRNQSMKGFSRVVIGSTVGGLLGAAAFFAVDGLIPRTSKAQSVDMGVHVRASSSGADKWVYLKTSSSGADKWVYVAGKCRGKGSEWVYAKSSSSGADEWWYVKDSPSGADMTICLSGDIDHWFETLNN